MARGLGGVALEGLEARAHGGERLAHLDERLAVPGDDDRRSEPLDGVERLPGRGRLVGPHIIGGRNTVRPAQVLGEALRSFEPGRSGTGSKNRNARFAKRVGDPGHERGFGADDDKIDRGAHREAHDRDRIIGLDRDALRPPRNPWIAGCREQLVAARRLPKPPRERIFPSAGSQQQNIHGPP